MQSKETILEIVTYSREHNITYKERCAEVGVPLWDFYESKRRYKRQESQPGNGVGEFIQLRPDGPMVPSNLLAIEGETKSGPKRATATDPVQTSSGMLSLELRTASGNVLRLYGQMNAAMLHELIQGL